MDKELAVWLHPESCSRWLSVQVDTFSKFASDIKLSGADDAPPDGTRTGLGDGPAWRWTVVDLVVRWMITLMILRIFSNLNDFMIFWAVCRKDNRTKPV